VARRAFAKKKVSTQLFIVLARAFSLSVGVFVLTLPTPVPRAWLLFEANLPKMNFILCVFAFCVTVFSVSQLT
jgi:hypothetical protein